MLQELNNYCQLALKLFFVVILNAPHIDWSLVSPVISARVSAPVNTQLCSIVNLLSLFLHQHARIIYWTLFQFSNQPHILTNVMVVDNLPDTDHLAWHCNLLLLYLHVISRNAIIYYTIIQRLTFRFFGIHYPVYHGMQLLIMILILIPSGASVKICFCQWLTHVSQWLNGKGIR